MKLKTKVRRFSNLIQKLSARDDEEEEEDESGQEEEEEEELEESPEQSYGSEERWLII